MQPLGRKKLRFPGKTDCHPPKGYINWWEDTISPCKKSARQEAKREISNEVSSSMTELAEKRLQDLLENYGY